MSSRALGFLVNARVRSVFCQVQASLCILLNKRNERSYASSGRTKLTLWSYGYHDPFGLALQARCLLDRCAVRLRTVIFNNCGVDLTARLLCVICLGRFVRVFLHFRDAQE